MKLSQVPGMTSFRGFARSQLEAFEIVCMLAGTSHLLKYYCRV
jgi:hypothetical protein